MKKICSILLCILTLCFTFSACESGATAGGSASGSSDIEISDPVFGFVRAADYDPETFDIDSASKWTDLELDEEYYLFLTLNVAARRDNDGQSLLSVKVTFDSLNILNGTMEDVGSGLIEEMIFYNADADAGTGNMGKTTTVSFKIPSLSAEPKTINMIVRLQPVQVGQSHIIIGYDYDAPSEYRLLGSDGHTKNLQIKAVKIEAPVLTLTELGSLAWKHVKNADYYQIFEAGIPEPLTDPKTGEAISVFPDGTSVGGDVYCNIGQYLTGYHQLVIRAFSTRSGILTSDYSNMIVYQG